MGFGISQEIYKETYQRPLIVNKEIQAGTKHVFVGVYPLGLFRSDGYGFAAVGGVGVAFL
ncbi:MAG: hypothetical protein KKH97_04135 [Proteobacteria bacterium]|nr:hypothetical protein [Pseudomonadota bacterium]